MNASVVKSAGRVFEVLALFDAERQAMTGTAIARALKYPASSSVALLKSMVNLGYLAYDCNDRTYFPTVQVAMLGRWVEDNFFVEGHLLDLLDDIAAATGECVMLAWQNDLHLMCSRPRGKDNVCDLVARLPTRLPLFESVAGLTLLTTKRDVEIAQMAERCNAQRRAGEAKVQLPMAMEKIRAFRALGYGVGYDFSVPGLGMIAWSL